MSKYNLSVEEYIRKLHENDNESLENLNKLAALMVKSGLKDVQDFHCQKSERINILFLIGSGASISAGIPLGNGLRDTLYNDWKEGFREDINRYFYTHFRDKLKTKEILFKSDRPLEDMTFEMLCSAVTEGLGVEKKWLIDNFFIPIIEKDNNIFRQIPLCYEIIAHLMSNKLIDDIISLNYDELLEKALDDELGKDGYFSVIRQEEWEEITKGNLKARHLVMKPHGSLKFKDTISFNLDDVKEFAQYKKDYLEEKLLKSYIVILGSSCSSLDVEMLFKEIEAKGYRHEIFWIKRKRLEEKEIKFLKNKIKWIILPEEAQKKNDRPDMINKLLYHLALKAINNVSNISEEGDSIPSFIKLDRHLIRNTFFSKNIIADNPPNKFLLEVIMFAIKIRRPFSERELLSCPRIENYIDELRSYSTLITPRVLLKRLLKVGIIKDIEPKPWQQSKIYKISKIDLICSRINKNFFEGSIDSKQLNRNKEEIKEEFKNIKENIDIDIIARKFLDSVSVKFHEGNLMNSRIEANWRMGNWLKRAKNIQCVSWIGAWIVRDQFEEIFNDMEDNTIELVLLSPVIPKDILKDLHNKKAIKKPIFHLSILECTKQKNHFTLIEKANGSKVVVCTLRKGTNGCMVWSEHNEDIEEADILFKRLKETH